MRQEILNEIDGEREYQDRKFGHGFDDKNTVNDWTAYIARYSSNAAFASTPHDQYVAFLKVAALATAALEAYRRNGSFPRRHYDR